MVLDIRGRHNMISQSIFRAYDIRGIFPDELNAESMTLIGRALGTMAKRAGEQAILLGRDGRLSGPELSLALQQGIQQTGCDVILVGVVPTPVLYFSTKVTGFTSGVMLTGSHNPSQYNGVKSVIAGETLFGETVMSLYESIVAGDFEVGEGHVCSIDDIIQQYINRVTDDVRLSRPMRVVIDCGNGVAGAVAPALFSALGCEVYELYCDIDGNFPNHHPDPSQQKNLVDLQAAVSAHEADIGLAFDGDGDRLGVVTSAGDIIWPDRQMIVLSEDVLVRNPGGAIIFDVKCSLHLKEAIINAGGKPVMSRTGHSYVKKTLNETGALLAGEMSGHIFFKERWYGFDDGLYTAARLLEILSRDDRSTAVIFDAVPDSINTPELQLMVPDVKKFALMERLQACAQFEGGEVCTIDGLRVEFADGWGLVRASNTTPCLVMRFESDSESGLRRIQALFKQQLLAVDQTLTLPF